MEKQRLQSCLASSRVRSLSLVNVKAFLHETPTTTRICGIVIHRRLVDHRHKTRLQAPPNMKSVFLGERESSSHGDTHNEKCRVQHAVVSTAVWDSQSGLNCLGGDGQGCVPVSVPKARHLPYLVVKTRRQPDTGNVLSVIHFSHYDLRIHQLTQTARENPQTDFPPPVVRPRYVLSQASRTPRTSLHTFGLMAQNSLQANALAICGLRGPHIVNPSEPSSSRWVFNRAKTSRTEVTWVVRVVSLFRSCVGSQRNWHHHTAPLTLDTSGSHAPSVLTKIQ